MGVGSGGAKHVGFLRHGAFLWLWVAAALSLAAIAGYRIAIVHPRPSGGTWYGYLLGTIATLLIIWLTTLGIRKRLITQGRWSLKGWVSAHVYLGLAVAVIATLHTGFMFGWNVHTLAYALVLLVVASGIVGVCLYVTLPRLLSENRAELTEAQMLGRLRALDARLFTAAQSASEGVAGAVRLSIERTRIGGGFWERLTGRRSNCGNRLAIARLTALGGSPGECAAIAALLREKETDLARTRRHIALRTWLEAWLHVHIPMTFALLAALTAHIVSVFFYW